MAGVPYFVIDNSINLNSVNSFLSQLQPRGSDEQKKQDEEHRRRAELIKLGLALHHEILPLIDGQKIDFGSSTTEFDGYRRITIQRIIQTCARNIDLYGQ